MMETVDHFAQSSDWDAIGCLNHYHWAYNERLASYRVPIAELTTADVVTWRHISAVEMEYLYIGGKQSWKSFQSIRPPQQH